MAGERHRDQQRNCRAGDQCQSPIDRKQGCQEQRRESEIDGEHRQLARKEAAQHVELAQPLGDDAYRVAHEVMVGKTHQVMYDLTTHHHVEPRRRPGRQPAARETQHEIECVNDQQSGGQHPDERQRTGRRMARQPVDDQHHEKRTGKRQQIDGERQAGEPRNRRPELGPDRRMPRCQLGDHRVGHDERLSAGPDESRKRCVPNPAPDDIEHRRPSVLQRYHDSGRPFGANQRKGHRQLLGRNPSEIDGMAVKAQAPSAEQERTGIERPLRQRRDAAQLGLADRPAELLDDVEQRPHQAVDRARPRWGNADRGGFRGCHSAARQRFRHRAD